MPSVIRTRSFGSAKAFRLDREEAVRRLRAAAERALAEREEVAAVHLFGSPLAARADGVRTRCTQRTRCTVLGMLRIVDVTIRKLDEDAYRRLKAAAALRGRTVGELVNEAIRAYLAQHEEPRGGGSLLDLEPEDYGPGQERLSERIDAIVYGGGGQG